MLSHCCCWPRFGSSWVEFLIFTSRQHQQHLRRAQNKAINFASAGDFRVYDRLCSASSMFSSRSGIDELWPSWLLFSGSVHSPKEKLSVQTKFLTCGFVILETYVDSRRDYTSCAFMEISCKCEFVYRCFHFNLIAFHRWFIWFDLREMPRAICSARVYQQIVKIEFASESCWTKVFMSL